MQDLSTKNQILCLLVNKLEETLNVLHAQYKRTRQEAIDAPGRMHSRYDSAKQELSYLAESIQKRIMQLSDEIRMLKNLNLSDYESINGITLGSLIEMQTEDELETRLYFILPVGGGNVIKNESINNNDIVVITPASPIYKILKNKNEGDDIVIGNKKLLISSIS